MGVFCAAISCALLGFADDYTKIVKRRSLGLRARTKLVVTIAISLGLWWIATQKANIGPTIELRFVHASHRPRAAVSRCSSISWSPGRPRAVNFTDGLDGLAAGCAAIVLLAYIGITFITGGARPRADLAGCLVRRLHRLPVVQQLSGEHLHGDTGSLGLGGAIAGLAVMTNTEDAAHPARRHLRIEVLSVVVQVFSFQVFRKRVFLMAPIHHHFELQAWSETKIILRFWIVAAAFGAIGFVVYQSASGERAARQCPAAGASKPRPPLPGRAVS